MNEPTKQLIKKIYLDKKEDDKGSIPEITEICSRRSNMLGLLIKIINLPMEK
jgi:hypothetical protein